MLQKQAIRIVEAGLVVRLMHADPLFKELKIISQNVRLRIHLLQLPVDHFM